MSKTVVKIVALTAAASICFGAVGCAAPHKEVVTTEAADAEAIRKAKALATAQESAQADAAEKQDEAATKDEKKASDQPAEDTAASGNQTIDDPSSLTVVVNKLRPLPATYAPQLVTSTVPSVGGQQLRPEANEALQKLYNAAVAATGQGFALCSGFRSYQTQTGLYANYVSGHGEAAANRFSARAGHSEHQTGLAADLVGPGEGCSLGETFWRTQTGEWINQHAHEYGFILRYPNGSENIVGYIYEPWHWRYLGVETATAVYNKGVTLEEFYSLPKAPSYAQ